MDISIRGNTNLERPKIQWQKSIRYTTKWTELNENSRARNVTRKFVWWWSSINGNTFDDDKLKERRKNKFRVKFNKIWRKWVTLVFKEVKV